VIARTQRWIVALLLLAAGGWVAVFAANGAVGVAWIGALAILNTQPGLIAIEYLVLMPYANRNDRTRIPGLRQRISAWWRESWTAHAVFSWRQPFRENAEPDGLDPGAHAGHHVLVLVHGFFCNRGLWNPWMRQLREHGIPFLAVTLEPAYGSIEEYVNAIDRAIERAWRATGVAPVIAAHSMGGLAVRAWWRAKGRESDERVSHVLTIGTPHHGTLTAYFAKGLNARQMRPGSPWLLQLAADEPPGRYARFTCFYSDCDNISMPAATATLPGAENRHVPGQPHVALVYAQVVLEEALRRSQAT
jgi:triacylglycerol lipase